MSLLVGVGLNPAVLAAGGSGPFTPIDPPAGAGGMAPSLTVAGEVAYLTWIESVAPPPGTDRDNRPPLRRLRFATFSDGSWGDPRTIVERDDFFANWADVPSLARALDGSLVAHWLQKSGSGTYAYDVMLGRSTDGGTVWQTLGRAHDDATQTEHGFVSMIPDAAGLRAFWLDGREMAAEGDQIGSGHGPGDMTLRTGLIGAAIGQSAVIDDRVCECCNTSAVMTADGPVVVYRDRSEEEARDISIIRRTGGQWTKPKSVHVDDWLIVGCPVNGPAVDARGRLVVVAWYTGAVDHGAVRVAFSTDSGATFGEPITIDESWPVGRTDVVLEPTGEAIVSWLDSAGASGAIVVCRVAPDGRVGRPVEVARADLGRVSGFPRIAALGGHLVVVWTDAGEPTHLRAARSPAVGVPAIDPSPE